MEKVILDFFEYHKIDLKDVFDAKGLSVTDVKEEMKKHDFLFAYNTTPCQFGHKLRDRHSHCIVCKTSSISFMKRSRQTGYLYIAGSIIKSFIKIGMTTETIEKRILKLNSRKVGNTNDWVILKSIKCDKVNIIEFDIHKELEKYKVEGEIYGDGIESSEIFRCKYEKANEVIENYFSKNNIEKKEQKTFIQNTEKYNNFRNIVNLKFSNKS